MKKVQKVLVLCALLLCSAGKIRAVSYGTPFSQPMDMPVARAELPDAKMGITSTWVLQHGAETYMEDDYALQGRIGTAARNISGGMTTMSGQDNIEEEYYRQIRRSPGVPGHVPLDGGWEIMAFMALIAAGYVVVKRRQQAA